jgi:hypothetical protein
MGWKPIMNSLRDVLDLGKLLEQQALPLQRAQRPKHLINRFLR